MRCKFKLRICGLPVFKFGLLALKRPMVRGFYFSVLRYSKETEGKKYVV